MRRKAFPRIDVVRREQKEARITEFIEDFIAGGAAGGPKCLMVARSLRSPVARAVATLVDAGRLELSVQAIFSSLEGQSDGAEGQREAAWAGAVRVARNPKLLDAHELLVLGPQTSWFGDCMRHEPEKRDAWERFATDCEETARQAQRSFERLWQASEPINAEVHPAARRGGTPARSRLSAR